jgi:hypothetical protein
MLIEIIRHTPHWVWGLMAVLLALGARQTRPQRMARAQFLALPLSLLALGLVSLAPLFMRMPLAAALWLLALALAAQGGARLTAHAGARWDAAAARLAVPGSYVPLLLIVAIFGLKYSFGVAVVLHPPWRNDAAVVLPMALMQGALGGLLLGRALALLVLTLSPTRAATIPANDCPRNAA